VYRWLAQTVGFVGLPFGFAHGSASLTVPSMSRGRAMCVSIGDLPKW
jgi:hypothetical protein